MEKVLIVYAVIIAAATLATRKNFIQGYRPLDQDERAYLSVPERIKERSLGVTIGRAYLISAFATFFISVIGFRLKNTFLMSAGPGIAIAFAIWARQGFSGNPYIQEVNYRRRYTKYAEAICREAFSGDTSPGTEILKKSGAYAKMMAGPLKGFTPALKAATEDDESIYRTYAFYRFAKDLFRTCDCELDLKPVQIGKMMTDPSAGGTGALIAQPYDKKTQLIKTATRFAGRPKF